MSGTPTWPKVNNAVGSTTSEFGALDWANLISDYYNGANIGLTDADKIPVIGTLTRYKTNKLAILDPDQSHYIIFSADDIDTGDNRQIRFRRMNSPFIEDFAVLEGMPQSLLNKTIDSDLNTITNIVNTDIKTAAGIVYSKLNLSNSIVAGDITSDAVTTVKILDANVTLAKLASNSVDSSKIVVDSIVNSDINSAAAIDWTKISKTGSILDDIADVVITTAAQYNIIMRNGSNQWINLAKGSNSTALTVDASGVLAYTTITNAMLAGSIVTAKLTDSANFILKTLDNSFGAHYQDFTKMTAPTNPGANDIRLYVDTADTHLKIRNSAGTVVDLHTGGGGATNLDALTDVDLTTTAPINGDVLTYTSTGTKWIPAAPPGGGGSVTASSVTTFTNKTIDADGTGNVITNIENADIKSGAGIVTTKLADSANFILKTLDNSFGAHYFDITRMTAPANPSANDGRFYTKQIDTNNDGYFVKIKKNGSFQEIQIA